MSIETLLEELVSRVKGASGAILLEADGEAVQWHPGADGERLRLRGAYIAPVLQACRATADRSGLGEINQLILEYDGGSFVVQEIDRDCFLVIELNSIANIGQAAFFIQSTAEQLRREILT